MFLKKSPILIFCLLLMQVITACKNSDQKAIVEGITTPVTSDGVEMLVLDAQIRQSYSSFYIMVYPPDSYIFYSIKISIQGLDEPESALEWGKANISLVSDQNKYELSHAKWTLIGDNITYEYGEKYTYYYEFIYSVPLSSDYSNFSLQLEDGKFIELNSILSTTNEYANLIQVQKNNQPEITVDENDNSIYSNYAAINGGSNNSAKAIYTTIGGGYLNKSEVAYSSISGGRENNANGLYSTIGGGYANNSAGRDSTIGGGSRNFTENYHSTISGGIRNNAAASDSTISGGAYNTASGTYSVIGGGTRNLASGSGTAIGGGAGNTASSDMSTISGGLGNSASGLYSFVGGGQSNLSKGMYSTVPGGSLNLAAGDYSFAAGYRAVINPEHHGAFLFSDSVDADFTSSSPNEFGIRATGGIRLISGVDDTGKPNSGVILHPGSGAWSILSDINVKENFSQPNPLNILDSVSNLRLLEWNYISQDDSIRHIGPTAQDFYSAFNLGEDNLHIDTVDVDGVALASIQGLNQKLLEDEKKIIYLENQLTNLSKQNNLLLFYSTTILITTICIFLVFFIHNQKYLKSRKTR